MLLEKTIHRPGKPSNARTMHAIVLGWPSSGSPDIIGYEYPDQVPGDGNDL